MKQVEGALASNEFAKRIWEIQAEHPGSEKFIARKLKDEIDSLYDIRVGKFPLARKDLAGSLERFVPAGLSKSCKEPNRPHVDYFARMRERFDVMLTQNLCDLFQLIVGLRQ